MEFTIENILVGILIIVIVVFLINTMRSGRGWGYGRQRQHMCPYCRQCPCAKNCPFRQGKEDFDVGQYNVNKECPIQNQLQSNYEMIQKNNLQGAEDLELVGSISPLEKQLMNELWTENQLQMQHGYVSAEDAPLFRASSNTSTQNAESPKINMNTHKVVVDCDGEFGKRIDNEVIYRKNQNIHEQESCNANAYRKLVGDTFDFATIENCDCHKGNGCSVCEMKHDNDHVISNLLCSKNTPLSNCYIDKVEDSNTTYIKGLQTGRNVL